MFILSDIKTNDQEESLTNSSESKKGNALEEDTSIGNRELKEEIDKNSTEEQNNKHRLPKWARITLMIAPAFVFAFIIILIDYFINLKSKGIFPMAILAITSLGLIGFATIGDWLYRNFFVTRMLRHESKKAHVYKQIIRERQEERKIQKKHEFIQEEESAQESSAYQYDEEYAYDEEYDYDEGDAYKEEAEFDDEEEEYEYEIEEELLDEKEYYRMKSLVLRGGLFTMILTNGLILLTLAFLLQLIFYGGFATPSSE